MRTIMAGFVILTAFVSSAGAGCEKVLLTGENLSAWQSNPDWTLVGDAYLHLRNENLLSTRDGSGVLINGPRNSRSLVSSREFGDVRAHIEFMIPKGSNSGVYFLGLYELQIFDSYGDANVPYPGNECGGIYPRWDENRLVKTYEGHSPKTNASRPPGQWQSFDCIFKAPRFDGSGKKVTNACFVKVVHNGVLIHQNIELTGPTRLSIKNDESAAGPIVLQGDHGPVAFRNIWVAPIDLDRMGFTNPFFAMDTGTIDEAHKTAKSQVEMLKELGYAGVAYWERNPATGIAGLAEMLTELDNAGLKPFPVYFPIKLEDPNEKYLPLITEQARTLANKDAIIWLAMASDKFQKSSPRGDERAVAVIRDIADAAHQYGVRVALYPRSDVWLEKVDDAVRLTEKANRRNIGVTFNLYHWLKTDKPANMEQIIKKAIPYLLVVTINGSSDAGSIETLDKGTFDVFGLLKTLNQEGFKGPIGLQGYGLSGDVRENLKRSMDAWRLFSQRFAVEQAENL